LRSGRFPGGYGQEPELACIIRWPVILMVLALMSALHAAYFAITFGLIASVLLIVLGGLLLMERTIGSCWTPPTPLTGAAYPGTTAGAPPPVEDAHSRAAWETSGQDAASSQPENPKGEQ